MDAEIWLLVTLWLLLGYAVAIILVGGVAHANSRDFIGWGILALLVTPFIALLALIGLGHKTKPEKEETEQ